MLFFLQLPSFVCLNLKLRKHTQIPKIHTQAHINSDTHTHTLAHIQRAGQTKRWGGIITEIFWRHHDTPKGLFSECLPLHCPPLPTASPQPPSHSVPYRGSVNMASWSENSPKLQTRQINNFSIFMPSQHSTQRERGGKRMRGGEKDCQTETVESGQRRLEQASAPSSAHLWLDTYVDRSRVPSSRARSGTRPRCSVHGWSNWAPRTPRPGCRTPLPSSHPRSGRRRRRSVHAPSREPDKRLQREVKAKRN